MLGLKAVWQSMKEIPLSLWEPGSQERSAIVFKIKKKKKKRKVPKIIIGEMIQGFPAQRGRLESARLGGYLMQVSADKQHGSHRQKIRCVWEVFVSVFSQHLMAT